jgi:phage shock protein PspC (stress-responsive transcriptional regulator)
VPADVLAPPAARLVRLRGGRVLGGVAAGLAQHLGIPVLWVRAALLVLAVAGGSGFALYGLYWLVLPLADDDGSGPDSRAWGQVAALGVMGLGRCSRSSGWASRAGAVLPLAPWSSGRRWCGGRPTTPAVPAGAPRRPAGPGGIALTVLGVACSSSAWPASSPPAASCRLRARGC